MKKKILSVVLIVLLAVLAAELVYVGCTVFNREGAAAVLSTEPVQTRPSEATDPTDATEPEESSQPTEPEETTQPTEPVLTSFLLTFTGDSTIGSDPNLFANPYGYILTIGDDYEYPFRNIAQYFREDELTLVNLEGVFADSGTGATKQFVFRGPTSYVNILTGSSVEAVTLANNHTLDFGVEGYESTKTALQGGGVTYVEDQGSVIHTTESGLVVGLYAAAFTRNDEDMKSEIASLRNQGAQVIVAAMHWGNEGQYRATEAQKSWAHALIDAGVDIVWGNHSHVLQPIEEYNGGIIYYSLGNCTFGGNTWPRDPDTAVLQQEVIVSSDGTVKLGKLTIIPCSVSSATTGLNNFQPTPYAEGSAGYDRVMSKLDGSWKGADLIVDYNNMGNG